jgi:hypothetical protein
MEKSVSKSGCTKAKFWLIRKKVKSCIARLPRNVNRAARVADAEMINGDDDVHPGNKIDKEAD